MTPGIWAIALTIGVLCVVPCGFAQVLNRPHQETPTDDNQSKINAKKPKNYPRAIAVIEFLPGGGTRLVPVALWINDRFYDASLYGANPAPMAVQPETVYEATNYGEPLGLFTVTTPEELKGSWVAAGKWKPHLAMDEKLAQQAAKQPKPKPADNFDSDRPILRRPGSNGSSASSGSSSAGAGASSSSGSTTQTASSSGTPSPAENDPNRPTLKKPGESTTMASPPSTTSPAQTAQAESSPASTPSSDENDPNRPVLRRGKPEPRPTAPEPTYLPAANPPKAVEAAQNKAATASLTNAARRSYPAVSYAGTFEPRSLLYAMNPEERSSKSEQMSALALDEIRKFIATRHTPALAKAAAITDYDLRAYDLEYSNSPTLVFTATLPVAGAKAFRGSEFDYYITFVAREDLNGTPIKIFSSVTDSNHLDAFPRMEIIDAVDADANGRGDLLFRQYSDIGISYSLYRVFPYNMQKVFEGGSGA